MNTTAKYTAGEGFGVWDSEAEFVANFNREMADAGLSKRITRGSEVQNMRVSVPARTDMPNRVDTPRQSGGNTNGSGKSRGKGATPKQLEWLVKMDGKKVERADVDAITAKAVREEFVTFDEAKLALDYLFDRSIGYRVAKPPTPTTTPVAPVERVTEGFYKMGDECYKVQRAIYGSGRLYAKVLSKAGWNFVDGIVNKLNESMKMSLEEACQFGKLYGVCVRCSRPLTKETSIERGMGDKCAGKW